MLHCLDVLWVNGFILYRKTSKAHPYVVDKAIYDQKRVLKLLIHSLLERANAQKETEKVSRLAIFMRSAFIFAAAACV